MQVAGSPLFEHAVSLLSLFSLSCIFIRSLFLSLFLPWCSFADVSTLTRLYAETSVRERMFMHPEGYLCWFARMHAATLVRAGEIYKHSTHTSLSVAGKIPLYIRAVTDEYRQILLFSFSSSSVRNIFAIRVLLILLDLAANGLSRGQSTRKGQCTIYSDIHARALFLQSRTNLFIIQEV